MELIDIENIDYVRLEDSLHCLEHHKGDEVECVICAPLVEAIPKDQYEARLKADMVAVLTELQVEIDEKATELCDDGWWLTYNNLIQQKINALQENKDEDSGYFEKEVYEAVKPYMDEYLYS